MGAAAYNSNSMPAGGGNLLKLNPPGQSAAAGNSSGAKKVPLSEEDQIAEAIRISKQEALQFVRQKSLEQKEQMK